MEFVLGAATFAVGILIGAGIVWSTMGNILNNKDNSNGN